MNGEVGIDIYTLLCIKYVTDKSILYSTGNSVLYSDLNGKEIHKRGAICMHMGFPDSSVDKEFTCNTGDPGLIRGLERSAGEGIGCPLQYSWASLVAQSVKNPLATWETWVPSLGWEDPLERKGYPLQYSGLENSMDCMGLQRVGHD